MVLQKRQNRDPWKYFEKQSNHVQGRAEYHRRFLIVKSIGDKIVHAIDMFSPFTTLYTPGLIHINITQVALIDDVMVYFVSLCF